MHSHRKTLSLAPSLSWEAEKHWWGPWHLREEMSQCHNRGKQPHRLSRSTRPLPLAKELGTNSHRRVTCSLILDHRKMSSPVCKTHRVLTVHLAPSYQDQNNLPKASSIPANPACSVVFSHLPTSLLTPPPAFGLLRGEGKAGTPVPVYSC